MSETDSTFVPELIVTSIGHNRRHRPTAKLLFSSQSAVAVADVYEHRYGAYQLRWLFRTYGLVLPKGDVVV